MSDQSERSSRLFGYLVRPAHWILLSLICVALDYFSGPQLQFPIAYLGPIGLASWYGGRRWGLTLAVILPLFRLLYYLSGVWDPPSSILESSINAGIEIIVFALFAGLIDRAARQMRELQRMRILEAMLGVCRECKKVHDHRKESWESLDAYMAGHPGDFKPGVCPECASRHSGVFERR